MTNRLGNYELPIGAILVNVREFETRSKPDIGGYKTTVLRNGPKAYRVATYWTIRDRHTGEVHHHSLSLRTFRRYKPGWIEDDKHKITISDEENDNEIQKLIDFLSSVSEINEDGKYLIVNSENLDSRLGDILKNVSASEKSKELIYQILEWVDTDVTANIGLIKLASDYPDRSKSLVAALNFGRYSKALTQMKTMIEENKHERFYQKFLEENYWMFGSEYSELIPKRTLTLGSQLDFPLRRTVDGYLDIIEIKTPLNGKVLFDFDRDHNNLFPSQELSKAVSQAGKYLRSLEADRYRIELQEKLKVDKVRAKVVIGRDGDDNQVRTLRSYNAEHVKIEVITYDQLIRIAERILEMMTDENPFLKELENA